MKKKFTDIVRQAGTEYSLSDTERARMSRVIREYMAHKPLPRAESPVLISYSWIAFVHRPLAAALVLVLVFGSSVSYAAENALPGDVLYSVKTYLNEPARLALATNAEAKAEVQIELAERRIEEATILAAEGRLDDDTQENLAVAFESHVSAATTNIAETEESDDSPASELATRFENRLAAHESIFAEVEIETESSENAVHSSRLTDAIRATSMVLAEARSSRNALAVNVEIATDSASSRMAASPDAATSDEPSTMAMSFKAAPSAEVMTMQAETSNAPAPDQKTISRMKDAAEKGLKSTKKALRSAKSLSAEARVRAETDIELAENLLHDGTEFLKDDNDAEAFATFEESSRVSEQARVFIKAAPTLEKARARAKNTRENNKNSETQPKTSVAATSTTITLPNDSVINVKNEDLNHDADDDRDDDEKDTERNKEKSGDVNLKIDLSL